MGRFKDQLIKEEDRGWYFVSRQMVCDSCVSNEALTKFIRANGIETPCEYCDSKPEETDLRCVPFDDLMDVIGERVNSEFTGADDEGIPWDSEEGQYSFYRQVFDRYDLITDVIGLDATESVLDEIIHALADRSWCRRQFFSLSLSEALGSGWNNFVHKVKYETRYLFTLPSPPAPLVADPQAEPVQDDVASRETDCPVSMGDPEFGVDYDREEGIPAYAMLDAIGKIVRTLNLVRVLDPGTTLYRVRVRDANELLSTPDELGPPSNEDATQPNRMSPAGIVMFYGALEKDTAIAETFQPDRDGAASKLVTVAQFETLSELVVLDLTALPPVPSFFESTSPEQRGGIGFLHEFVDDLIQPIARDGSEHIDYVPTQIVTEYFRHRFLTEDGRRLLGILYPSSRLEDGTSCVLFVDRFECGVPAEYYSQDLQKLRLFEDRIERLWGADLLEKQSCLGRSVSG